MQPYTYMYLFSANTHPPQNWTKILRMNNLFLTIFSGIQHCPKLKASLINPFKPEFTIVIFIHYKPRIAIAILDLQWMKMI